MTPQTAAVLVDESESYQELDAGENTTCGITLQGRLKCWGNNSAGQLGDGTTMPSSSPVVVDAMENYQKISVGGSAGFHVCGITTSNKLKCWGSNSSGQLGLGTTGGNQLTPIQIGSEDYSDVSSNGSATCALSTENILSCWGLNSFYQLGDGSNINKNSPQFILDLNL